MDEKKILTAVGAVSEKLDEHKSAYEKELDKLRVENKAIEEKFQTKIDEMNRELGEKGATLKQIQEDVKNENIKAGRLKFGSPNKPMSLKAELSKMIKDNEAEFKKMGETGDKFALKQFIPEINKTVGDVSSSNLTGDTYQSYIDWRPGMEPTGQTRFRDLVRLILSDTDYVQFPRANTPIGEGSFGRQATEAAAKAQVDRDYTMIDVTLKPMAGYAIVTRQSLRNIPFLQTWLPTSMLEQLSDQEDLDFANTLVAAANGSTTASGITVAAEKLIYYIKNNIAAKYNTSAIVGDPTIWAEILVTKPNDYSTPGVVVIDPNGTVRFLGRPFYPVNWLTGRRVVVGDWSKAAIVQSEGLVMRQSDSHASTFVANEITFLLERTEGLAVFRTDAFITAVL